MYKTKNMVVYVQFALCVSLALLVQNASGLSVNGPTSKVTFNVTGLMPAVFTSLNDDQSVNLEVIPLYADYLVSKGVRAILVGGTSGEHVSLSVSDRRELITAWVKAVDARMHVQVQVGGAPFPDVIALAKHSAEVGADSIITLPDVYSRPQTVGDLVSYVGMVARAVPNLPVFYYHIPAITNVVLNMPQFVRVATTSIPNFMGLKFTSADLVEAAEILKVLADGQQLLLGGERLVAPGSLLGIRTFVSPGNNIYPGLMQGVLDAAQGGDIQRARAFQNTLTTAIDEISREGGRIPALKMALEKKTGLKVGPPALPKRSVTIENELRIGDIIRRIKDNA